MRGHAEAQYNLALMCWAGEGVRRSVAAAHKWLEKAARSRDLSALRAIAEGYESGQLGYRKNGCTGPVLAPTVRPRKSDRAQARGSELAPSTITSGTMARIPAGTSSPIRSG